MPIKIRYKKLKDGMLSPYLDIHYHGTRKSEYLDMRIKDKANSSQDRINKKEQLAVIDLIAYKRGTEMVTNQFQLPKIVINTNEDFFVFFQKYIDNSKNKDIRVFISVLNKMKALHKDKALFCYEITSTFIQKVVDHFYTTLNGVSPVSYSKKLRQVIKEARRQKYILTDPFSEIVLQPRTSKMKDVLSTAQLNKLFRTECGNIQVKRAFLFACLTGLRFCDVKTLQWKHIKNDNVQFSQHKTGTEQIIALNSEAKSILQKRKKNEDFIFNLPSHSGCLKSIRYWVKKADINLHITFHCARHTFGTVLNNNGVDINTISSLLGHTSLKYTKIYTRYSDKLAQAAIAMLPSIFDRPKLNEESKISL